MLVPASDVSATRRMDRSSGGAGEFSGLAGIDMSLAFFCYAGIVSYAGYQQRKNRASVEKPAIGSYFSWHCALETLNVERHSKRTAG